MKKILTMGLIFAVIIISNVAATPDPDETKSISKFGQVGLWNTLSAQTLGFGRLSFQVYGNHSMDKKFIKNIYRYGYYMDNVDGELTLIDSKGLYSDPSLKIPDYARETFNVSLSYGITRYLDLAVMVPVYIDWMGNTEFKSYPDDEYFWPGDKTSKTIGGIGDIDISVKFQYPPYPHRKFFEMAYYGALTIPSGRQGAGYFPRHLYYTDKRSESGVYHFYTSNNTEIDMKMLWTWDFREMSDVFPVLFHFNYGLRWTLQWINEHVFYLNSGLEVRPAEWVSIFVDFSAEPRFGSIQQEQTWKVVKDDSNIGDHPEFRNKYEINEYNRSLKSDPMRISPGVAFLTPSGLTISAGVDLSLSNKKGFYYGDLATFDESAQQNVLIETAVEPKVAFAASIGWNGLMVKRQTIVPDSPIAEPEPICDTVRIIDTVYVDRIDTLEVEVEKAPKPIPTYTITASVAAGQGTITPVGVNVVKEGTMVIYSFGPAEGFSIEQVTVNGENQGALAQYTFASVMSNQIITVSFKQDPVTVVEVIEMPAPAPVAIEIPREGLILRGVNFQTGKATLTGGSYDALDAVIKSLRDWPEVKLEIQGHTDNVGKREANMKLSQQRAETVMKYFINQGVPANRLKAVGYGPDVPIAENDTPAGKELNRRVELKRID
ncbi:MAG: OmpA family protein [Chitinispirillales bacterium]|jgi:outer membrane protein OmpA-like peptidoglycan-associated protein|nr:OmpA family protein [Chitinispirillales bacterium]